MRLLEGRMHRHHQLTSYNHLVEIFGGCHALTRGMREQGYEAEVFDIRVNSDHNIHVEEGLMTLCRMLVRTAPRRSVVGIQPTYTSWVNEEISLRKVVARLYNIIYFFNGLCERPWVFNESFHCEIVPKLLDLFGIGQYVSLGVDWKPECLQCIDWQWNSPAAYRNYITTPELAPPWLLHRAAGTLAAGNMICCRVSS